MKKALLSAAVTCLCAAGAVAATHTINVQNTQFIPNTMTFPLGDTVIFSWVSGSHTTTSTGIPAGAAAWDNPITTSAATFTYVPTVVGTYNYKCTPHENLGMIGSFTVTAPTAIGNTAAAISFTAYPNPANGNLHISLPDPAATSVQLVNSNGSIVYQAAITQATDINTGNLANGMYFLSVQQGAASTVRAITIAH